MPGMPLYLFSIGRVTFSLSAVRSNRFFSVVSLPPDHLLQVVDGYNEYLDSNNRSLWLFKPENPVRRVCTRVTGNPWFGRVVLTLVLASCVVMALDDPGCKDACKQEPVLSKVWGPWEQCLVHVGKGRGADGRPHTTAWAAGSRADATYGVVPGMQRPTVDGIAVHRQAISGAQAGHTTGLDFQCACTCQHQSPLWPSVHPWPPWHMPHRSVFQATQAPPAALQISVSRPRTLVRAAQHSPPGSLPCHLPPTCPRAALPPCRVPPCPPQGVSSRCKRCDMYTKASLWLVVRLIAWLQGHPGSP